MALNLTQFKADLKASMKAAAESNNELSPKDPAAALDKAKPATSDRYVVPVEINGADSDWLIPTT